MCVNVCVINMCVCMYVSQYVCVCVNLSVSLSLNLYVYPSMCVSHTRTHTNPHLTRVHRYLQNGMVCHPFPLPNRGSIEGGRGGGDGLE